MARKTFGLEWYTANQNSPKSLGYVPVVQRSRFQNWATPLFRGERRKYQICTISPGFPWVPRRLTHGEANDKCKTETAYRRESNMNMWASRCPKWNLDDSCCGACWLTLKRQPMNINFLIEENKQTNVTGTRETLKKISKTGACRTQLAVYFWANILISFQHNTKKNSDL